MNQVNLLIYNDSYKSKVMIQDLVSVVIPTYSRPVRLLKAIKSVLNQSYLNIELIVVDDNNPDTVFRNETENIISTISDERFKYIRHDINSGANVARNTGIEASNGKYIALLDDDDQYLPNKIEEQMYVVRKYHSNDEGIFVFTGATRIGDSNYSKSKWMSSVSSELFFPDEKLILSKNYIGSNSYALVDRISLIQANLFDISMPSCQDWDLFIRLALNNVRFIGVNKALVEYYDHDEIRITNSSRKKIEGHLLIEKKYKNLIRNISVDSLLEFYEYLFFQFLIANREFAKKELLKYKSDCSSLSHYFRYIILSCVYRLSVSTTLIDYMRKIRNFFWKGV